MPALAQDAEPAPAPMDPVAEERVLSPSERLSAAVSTYQANQPVEAQVMLAQLVNDQTYDDPDLRQRARVYLGEVLYRQQDQEAARRVFERVLSLDPNYILDPFRHPPDVCGFFETIRAYIKPPEQPRETIAQQAPPLPKLGYMGFGLYQIKHGRSGLGAVMLTTQTLAGVLSFVEFADLLNDHGYPELIPGEREFLVRRRTVQWVSTTAFWSVWGWSIIDAARHWRTNVNIWTIPAAGESQDQDRPPGIQLQVHGRFR